MKTICEELAAHLAWWGLRKFDSDAAYFQWQREALSRDDLICLNQLIEQKRAGGAASEAAFYDFMADPRILRTLYSQRYDYFLTVGPAVASRIRPARTALDFGCGVGVLTTFYASCCPDVFFVGVDRSGGVVAAAQEQAARLGLDNIRFDQADVEHALKGTYDLIISTHALVQAEVEPGIPSRDWRTFERAQDPYLQAEFERRTGLGSRLDTLVHAVAPNGRMILFEKTRQLARRVPFQRALFHRGFIQVEPSIPIRYCVIEEIHDDGPFYVVAHQPEDGTTVPWDETPERADQDEVYRCSGGTAMAVWKRLPERAITRRETWPLERWGAVQAERGRFGGTMAYWYLMAGEGHKLLTGRACDINRVGPDAPWLRALFTEETPSPVPEGGAVPLYENHTVYAQSVWDDLPDRRILLEKTLDGPDGKQMHVELGEARELTYLYWANTFDQRQVVIVERDQSRMLEQYYHEFLDGA
jgi:SAM-dependent methyltransferase